MARPLRIEFDGAWYHVMNRGAGKRPIFLSAAHRGMFLQLLGEIWKIYRIEIHAYCLMLTHYHLFLRTPIAGLARAMRHLDGVYTQRFNRDVGTDGPLMRGRYKSVLVGGDRQFCAVSRYVHLNPVDANIVSRPEDYWPSSYRAYLGLEVAPAWLYTDETLERFGPGDARLNYRRFVEAGIDEETRAFFGKARRKPVYGPEEFRKQIEERVHASRAASDPERPDRVLLTDRPGLDQIGDAVCRAFETSPTELHPESKCLGGYTSAARGALALLGREVGGQSLHTIATWIGYRSYAGASRAMGRLKVLIAQSPDIRDRVEAARRELTVCEMTRFDGQAKT